MTVLRFHVLGKPVGKERPRAVRTASGRVRVITAKKTEEYEHFVHLAARSAVEQLELEEPLDGALGLSMQIALEVPESWAPERRAAALAGRERPVVKPDFDNVAKAICDAMNGVVYRDDAQIVESSVRKIYGPLPGVLVTIETIGAA